MQNVAAENNLAETAFIAPITPKADDCSSNDSCHYSIRWFTPNAEVDLCGHATLASAHALYDTGRVPRSLSICFHTLRSGVLTTKASSSPGCYSMDFPSTPPAPVTPTDSYLSVLHTVVEAFPGLLTLREVVFVGRSAFDVLVEVTPWAFARMMARDGVLFDRIASLGGRGLLVTCMGAAVLDSEGMLAERFDLTRVLQEGVGEHSPVLDRRFHFLSRCFFPRVGINEDPVTGSAHCALAPYWTPKLTSLSQPNVQPPALTGFQASHRGGVVTVQLVRRDDGDRVMLSGPCVTTLTSRLCV
mmetsp:Transcript_564/g.955  ORF Transcript_564/g.955 Transcript_564/m.955 type:complete len:301 (-) Transcript_564:95-997(-)